MPGTSNVLAVEADCITDAVGMSTGLEEMAASEENPVEAQKWRGSGGMLSYCLSGKGRENDVIRKYAME